MNWDLRLRSNELGEVAGSVFLRGGRACAKARRRLWTWNICRVLRPLSSFCLSLGLTVPFKQGRWLALANTGTLGGSIPPSRIIIAGVFFFNHCALANSGSALIVSFRNSASQRVLFALFSPLWVPRIYHTLLRPRRKAGAGRQKWMNLIRECPPRDFS